MKDIDPPEVQGDFRYIARVDDDGRWVVWDNVSQIGVLDPNDSRLTAESMALELNGKED